MASTSSPTLLTTLSAARPLDYNKLPVSELKDLLRSYTLPVTDTKSDLVARLQQHDTSHSASPHIVLIIPAQTSNPGSGGANHPTPSALGATSTPGGTSTPGTVSAASAVSAAGTVPTLTLTTPSTVTTPLTLAVSNPAQDVVELRAETSTPDSSLPSRKRRRSSSEAAGPSVKRTAQNPTGDEASRQASPAITNTTSLAPDSTAGGAPEHAIHNDRSAREPSGKSGYHSCHVL